MDRKVQYSTITIHCKSVSSRLCYTLPLAVAKSRTTGRAQKLFSIHLKNRNRLSTAAAAALPLPYRVVGEIGVTVVAVVLGHPPDFDGICLLE